MRRFFLAVLTGAVALALGPGTGAAQDAVVQHDGPNATGITNLDVGGTRYDVTFVYDQPLDIYGLSSSPIFDFPGDPPGTDAEEAAQAVVDALNTVSEVETVGPNNDSIWNIGFDFDSFCLVQQGAYSTAQVPDVWSQPTDFALQPWTGDFTYAVFEELPTPTEPATWGRIKALYK